MATRDRRCSLPYVKDYTKKPFGLDWRSNTLFIVTTVGIGLFTDLFLYGLVVPILPSILRDKVGVPDGDIQGDVSGLLAAYAAASVITSPFAGILADRLSSRQAPFLVGLLALLMATVLLFVGTTIPGSYTCAHSPGCQCSVRLDDWSGAVSRNSWVKESGQDYRLGMRGGIR
jgi:MFS family permease